MASPSEALSRFRREFALSPHLSFSTRAPFVGQILTKDSPKFPHQGTPDSYEIDCGRGMASAII